MDNIDHIYVINLDKRQDRLAEFMKECKKVDLDMNKVERFPAIYIPDNPCLGCNFSHLGVIKLAKEKGYKNVLVFEDDFIFLVDKNELNANVAHVFDNKIKFKVLMFAYYLACTPVPHDDVISTVDAVSTAACYLVNESCYDELIDLLSFGTEMLAKTGEHWNYTNDQIWKQSQKNGLWFIFNKRMGSQSNGFSDISGRVKTYEASGFANSI